jgi:hypothetical protein
MSLSQKNLTFIQKAGQAIHGASEAIADNVRTQAENMVASLSSQPFGVESEQAVARFKTLSRLSQGLASMEAELQDLYALALELSNPASDVIILPSVKQRKAGNAEAMDVLAKPAVVRKVAAKKEAKRPAKPVSLTPNDTKLLHYLQGVLKTDAWTAITGGVMAKEADLPLGSVGVSVKKILAAGAVKLGGRSMYRLPTTAAPAAAAEPETPAAPTPKAKPALAEKSKPAKAAAPAAKQAKAKPATKTQAANSEVPAVQETAAKPARKSKAAAAPVAPAPVGEAEAAPM